tara:strand:- start:17876 stop:19378 length:1503 start_codon:yes stop_codon:yes gene_type:complete
LRPGQPVVVALSGGADSVFLLHLVARAEPRPKVLAVHVDHGLRGDASEGDAAFCARLCARLGIPFARRRIELDGDAPDLEARARELRYRALAEEARQAGIATILTGHHEDDALETLLQRWLRGSALPGLPGLLGQRRVGPSSEGSPLSAVRPLLSMRREEVRRVLRDSGFEWREDASNTSPDHTRNRVRHGLLPQVEATCGPEGLEGLRAFAAAVESLEEELAQRTAHLGWKAPTHAPALRSEADQYLGGRLARPEVAVLATPLQRRALWRLIHEGTGQPPSRGLVEAIVQDLNDKKTCRHALPGGWILQLSREDLLLVPPTAVEPEGSEGSIHDFQVSLSIPGEAVLPDGRVLRAERVEVEPGQPVPAQAALVELDGTDLCNGSSSRRFTVRSLRSGDRFHGLGAPGSRRLTRFLSDAGVPKEERSRVPLVFAEDENGDEELIWVAGIRPCEGRRVRSTTRVRLRLTLKHAAPVEPEPKLERLPREGLRLPGGQFITGV